MSCEPKFKVGEIVKIKQSGNFAKIISAIGYRKYWLYRLEGILGYCTEKCFSSVSIGQVISDIESMGYNIEIKEKSQ